MRWKDEFDEFYKSMILRSDTDRLTPYGLSNLTNIEDFISTEIIEKLIVDTLTLIHDSKTREYVKQQLRDKWL